MVSGTALMTPSEAGAALRVSPQTVAAWAARGLLDVVRTLGGHSRYKTTQIRELVTGNTFPALVRAIELEFAGWHVWPSDQGTVYAATACCPSPGFTLHAPDVWQMRDAIAAQTAEWKKESC